MLPFLEETITWCGKDLTIQIDKVARQSDGAVLIKYDGVTILSTLVVDKRNSEVGDFLPLTVNFIAKSYAFGKIPGGFFKREGKPSEQEIILSRIIDRSIRPFFPENFHYPVSICCILLSHDYSVTPEVPAVLATSIATIIANIISPEKLIAAVRLTKKDNQYILNPSSDQIKNSDCSLILSGTNKDASMIEASYREFTEEDIVESIQIAQDAIFELTKIIKKFLKKLNLKDPINLNNKEDNQELEDFLIKKLNNDYFSNFERKNKKDVVNKISELNYQIIQEAIKNGFEEKNTEYYLQKIVRNLARERMLKTKKRLDGRGYEDIREITSEVKILQHTHGSALFTRGNTQVLAATTLGTHKDQQITECLYSGDEKREHFILHYNFFSFATGEINTKPSPNRREIGHGKLANKAFKYFIPDKDSFPHTIRVVAEVLESDGSSSMATVCATSMSLMDAGVQIPKPIAGIAMGLIKEQKKVAIISDISGTEDAIGDMDFKITGTYDGITALQMDIKIPGINNELIKKSLLQANNGIKKILSKMSETISMPTNIKKDISTIRTMQIKQSEIKNVIGAGGKVIKNICETTSATIDISPSGLITISSSNKKNISDACAMIEEILEQPTMGTVYNCKITKIMDFGIIVSFMNNKSGLIHSSEINLDALDEKIVVGKMIQAVLLSESNGKYKLSIKKVNNKN